MNPNDFKHFNMSFRIVPTIGKNPFAQADAYKHTQHIEAGRPIFPEPAEPENMDCSDALAVIASIKAGL